MNDLSFYAVDMLYNLVFGMIAGAGGMLSVIWLCRKLRMKYHDFKATREAKMIMSEKDLLEQKIKASKPQKETYELWWRNQAGLQIVEIVIDHEVDSDTKPEDGTYLILGNQEPELAKEEAHKIKRFRIPPQVAKSMRMGGVTPDEVVTHLLKNAGRMS